MAFLRRALLSCWPMLILFSLAVAACTTGRDFSRPSPDAFVLGKTTKQDILATYGDPQEETEGNVNLQPIDLVMYIFADKRISGRADTSEPGFPPVRALELGFIDNVLTMYFFISTFKVDNTNFDEKKIEQIVEGEDSCNKVISIFGSPHGYAVAPMMSQPGKQSLLYTYPTVDAGRKVISVKLLEVICDANDVVAKRGYTSFPVRAL